MSEIVTEETVLAFLRQHGPATNTEIAQRIMRGPVCHYTMMRTDEMLRRLMLGGLVTYANYVYKAT
jgi:hypothetical protein